MGMYGLCDTEKDEARWAAVLKAILRAGASVWSIDNAGLSAAYLALGASGCLQCLDVFASVGKMTLDSVDQIARLYPGARAEVFFTLLREMEGRQMLLASALLRMHSAAATNSAVVVAAEHCSSSGLSSSAVELLATLRAAQQEQDGASTGAFPYNR